MNFRNIFGILAACIAGSVGGTLSSHTSARAPAPSVIRATKFELVNRSGIPVALGSGFNGEAHLSFIHDKHIGIALGAHPNGRPFLEIADGTGRSDWLWNAIKPTSPCSERAMSDGKAGCTLGSSLPIRHPTRIGTTGGFCSAPAGSQRPVVGVGMTNPRDNPAKPFLTISGKSTQ